MHRILISLALFIAVATPARAQYTTATVVPCPNDGKGGVCVAYSGSGVKTTEAGDNRYTARTAADLATATATRKAELNGQDTTQKAFTVGSVIADPVVGPVGPSADDLAATAFQALVVKWRAAQVKRSMGSLVDKDVTDAWALVFAAYTGASAALIARYDSVLFASGRGF